MVITQRTVTNMSAVFKEKEIKKQFPLPITTVSGLMKGENSIIVSALPNVDYETILPPVDENWIVL